METNIEVKNFSGSSNILRADYDMLMETMKVYFTSGAVYTYVAVPKKVFDDFGEAESAGRFFVAHVKNHYDFLRAV